MLMCFTVNVNIVKEEMEKRFDARLTGPDSYRPSYYYHAFELPKMPVITNREPDMIRLYQWGLIPSWTRSAERAEVIRYKTFNARAESVTGKPSFQKPFQTNRCLVIASGYYEWQHRKDMKVPHFIHLKNRPVFSFAGIFDDWLDRSSGELASTFSIITTQANAKMALVHNSKKRMPVILSEADEQHWLDHNLSIPEALTLLCPYPEDLMDYHAISLLITKKGADKNVPGLITPCSYDPPTLF